MKKPILKFTKEQASLIESYSYVTNLEREFYFIPYWFEKVGDGLYTQHSLERLPEDIQKIIREQREFTGTPKLTEKKTQNKP